MAVDQQPRRRETIHFHVYLHHGRHKLKAQITCSWSLIRFSSVSPLQQHFSVKASDKTFAVIQAHTLPTTFCLLPLPLEEKKNCILSLFQTLWESVLWYWTFFSLIFIQNMFRGAEVLWLLTESDVGKWLCFVFSFTALPNNTTPGGWGRPNCTAHRHISQLCICVGEKGWICKPTARPQSAFLLWKQFLIHWMFAVTHNQ